MIVKTGFLHQSSDWLRR